ncbi:hypothetical protein AVDCRST_MAG94-4934 [uncultured Leptolyngbya sp.]|uniref:Uncharacterized protein n=1 Tax=uncultured Leptolyngbya sp. TaxID=332963 RepID=A0A6J4N9C5_9CYAN|nr:hypothetical protein AVDCRST_MAG94-4934 [uncultured Leptolyngbya sp.]
MIEGSPCQRKSLTTQVRIKSQFCGAWASGVNQQLLSRRHLQPKGHDFPCPYAPEGQQQITVLSWCSG